MASDPVRAGLRGPDGHLPLDFRGVPRRGGAGRIMARGATYPRAYRRVRDRVFSENGVGTPTHRP